MRNNCRKNNIIMTIYTIATTMLYIIIETYILKKKRIPTTLITFLPCITKINFRWTSSTQNLITEVS